MTGQIELGSWVEHPTHGLAQVWDVWVLDVNDLERPTQDDGVVLIANDEGAFRVDRATLKLADLGPEIAGGSDAS